MGATLAAAVARLDDVASDLWAALAYSAEHDPHTALCLASKLPRWWRFRGRDQQGRQWLRRLLDDPRTADADPIVRAWAKLGRGPARGRTRRRAGPNWPAARPRWRSSCSVGDVTGELADARRAAGRAPERGRVRRGPPARGGGAGAGHPDRPGATTWRWRSTT